VELVSLKSDSDPQDNDFFSEARSLKDNPLPLADNDGILPTRIAALDNKIATRAKELQDLQFERATLLDHALKMNILEDSAFRIVKGITYGDRVVDPVKLKAANEKVFETYLATVMARVDADLEKKKVEAYAKVSTTIKVGIADTLFGKSVVDACSTKPETVSWKVTRK
jgi:hypothetical protein